MEQNRELFEKIIKCGNIYANNHHKVVNLGLYNDVSLSQIQVLEYVLEVENQKMSDIAKRLGITKSALSQIAKKLEEKGWLGTSHLGFAGWTHRVRLRSRLRRGAGWVCAQGSAAKCPAARQSDRRGESPRYVWRQKSNVPRFCSGCGSLGRTRS